MSDEEVNIEVKGSGAYVEVWRRDGKPVARLCGFDRDLPLSREELVRRMHALQEAHDHLVTMEVAGMEPLMATLHRASMEIEAWPKWKRDMIVPRHDA